MARIKVGGLDELMDDLEALAQLPDELLDDVLDAEADVIVDGQRSEVQKQWKGPYSQGISAKSIKKGRAKKGKDGHSVTVYPQGTRKRGKKSVRNAEIAFINEYGAPKRGVAARPAINAANTKKEKEAVDAGEKVYHAYLDSKKL